MTTNFLELATTWKYLGAKWLLEKKVNFTPCFCWTYTNLLPCEQRSLRSSWYKSVRKRKTLPLPDWSKKIEESSLCSQCTNLHALDINYIICIHKYHEAYKLSQNFTEENARKVSACFLRLHVCDVIQFPDDRARMRINSLLASFGAWQSWKTTAHVINLRGKTGDDMVKP